VLICFEDVFSNLARGFVEQGAKFLVVITNDAWFQVSSAPYQHLQASIFRAVENGVSVVRAANTGVSAFISPKGVVMDRVQDDRGNDIFVTGAKTREVSVEPLNTWYRRGGYLFPYGVFLVFVTMLFVLRLKMRPS